VVDLLVSGFRFPDISGLQESRTPNINCWLPPYGRTRLRIDDQVDVFYLHCPDSKTSLSETLGAVNEAFQLGYFKRFGLSNFFAEEVQNVYDLAKEKGYVLPTVYQGNYNPVARLQETLLFPTLRKLGIAFYAYSPLAGGFLTKTAADIKEGKGRFNDTVLQGVYKALYVKPAYIDALAKWEAAAAAESVTRAELATRWVAFNPLLKKERGDGIIIGVSSNEQLEQTLNYLKKGKLSDEAIKAIDDIWEAIKHEAPYDNFHRDTSSL